MKAKNIFEQYFKENKKEDSPKKQPRETLVVIVNNRHPHIISDSINYNRKFTIPAIIEIKKEIIGKLENLRSKIVNQGLPVVRRFGAGPVWSEKYLGDHLYDYFELLRIRPKAGFDANGLPFFSAYGVSRNQRDSDYGFIVDSMSEKGAFLSRKPRFREYMTYFFRPEQFPTKKEPNEKKFYPMSRDMLKRFENQLVTKKGTGKFFEDSVYPEFNDEGQWSFLYNSIENGQFLDHQTVTNQSALGRFKERAVMTAEQFLQCHESVITTIKKDIKFLSEKTSQFSTIQTGNPLEPWAYLWPSMKPISYSNNYKHSNPGIEKGLNDKLNTNFIDSKNFVPNQGRYQPLRDDILDYADVFIFIAKPGGDYIFRNELISTPRGQISRPRGADAFEDPDVTAPRKISQADNERIKRMIKQLGGALEPDQLNPTDLDVDDSLSPKKMAAMKQERHDKYQDVFRAVNKVKKRLNDLKYKNLDLTSLKLPSGILTKMFSLRESRLNSIFEHYYKQNNILLQEIIPPDDIEDYIDVEDLPENERLRVYSVIFNSGQELTDREEKEFLDMIKAKKFQNQELADVEKKFVLSKIDMENMVS